MTLDRKGFSFVELIVVMGIIAVLLALASSSFAPVTSRTSLTENEQTFLVEFKSQQIKSMIGDTEGRVSPDTYGLHFESTSFTLFHGATYSAAESTNFKEDLDSGITVSTSFNNNQIIFSSSSGTLKNFVQGSNTVTFHNIRTNEQKVITINRYGVATSEN